MTRPAGPGGGHGQSVHRAGGFGREVSFALVPSGDPEFPQRLVLPGRPGGWIVLSYAAEAIAAPSRPLLRILRRGGEVEDAVLPGPALGYAHWLGLIPEDAVEIRLDLAPGTVLERVGRRHHAGIVWDCLLRRPGHAVAALYERLRGQRRRAHNTLRAGVAVAPLRRYADWAAPRAVPFTGRAPDLAIRCVVLVPAGAEEALFRTLSALKRQSREPHDLIVARETPAGAAPPGTGTLAWDPGLRPEDLLGEGEALCVLRAGDVPDPDALALLSAGLGDAEMAYGDEIGPDGLPRLKPDWSPDLALATGYVGRPTLLSRALVQRLPRHGLGPLSEAATGLDLAVALACRRAVHLSRPLARVVDDPRSSELRATLLTRGQHGATIYRRDGVPDLRWPLPDPPPLASVVIPSRDRLDLIREACRGVLEATAYPSIELIVVDNASSDPAVLAFYDTIRRDPRVKVLPYPHPFNFAAMVNAGVEAAAGEVVVLFNNDVAVRGAEWLSEMVRQALRPEVGAVGAKLLFGDGTLQHAGVVVGLSGRAGHILRRRPSETPGRLGRLRVAHEVSAVTAACLAVTREKYRAVGGFDAKDFAVDFNDVDFCLRLAAAGWKCVWTPAATLSHFESISRGPSVGAKRARFEEEAGRFTRRWREAIRHDPFYHPALSLTTFGEELE